MGSNPTPSAELASADHLGSRLRVGVLQELDDPHGGGFGSFALLNVDDQAKLYERVAGSARSRPVTNLAKVLAGHSQL